MHVLLMGALSEPHVSIVTEDSEMDRRVVMTIRYRLLLTEADPAMDELAFSVLRGIVTGTEYHACGEAEDPQGEVVMEITDTPEA